MQHVFGFSRKQNPVLRELLHESLFPCSGGRGKSWITHKVSDVFMRLSESHPSEDSAIQYNSLALSTKLCTKKSCVDKFTKVCWWYLTQKFNMQNPW